MNSYKFSTSTLWKQCDTLIEWKNNILKESENH